MTDNAKLYIGVDIGGTYARVAAFDSLEKPLFHPVKIFKLTHVFENDFNNIIQNITELAKGEVKAIGMGLPGTLNEEKNTLIEGDNIKEWWNINIKEKLVSKFNCEVSLENDAVVSALGEAVFGGHTEDFIFMIWGTGIGGARVMLKPILQAEKINFPTYFQEFESKCGGHVLIQKYHKSPKDLTEAEWAPVMKDFEQEVVSFSDKIKSTNIVIGGGIALKEKKRLELLSQKLKKEKNINFRTTNLGDSDTFSLYGTAVLIKSK